MQLASCSHWVPRHTLFIIINKIIRKVINIHIFITASITACNLNDVFFCCASLLVVSYRLQFQWSAVDIEVIIVPIKLSFALADDAGVYVNGKKATNNFYDTSRYRQNDLEMAMGWLHTRASDWFQRDQMLDNAFVYVILNYFEDVTISRLCLLQDYYLCVLDPIWLS